MGHRNLDRIGMDEWRHAVSTVGRMQLAQWRMQARCGKCGGIADVDLVYLGIQRGIDFSPWNRSQPCRTLRCKGMVTFWARIPGIRRWQRLQAPDYVPRETLGERAERLKREESA